MPRRKFSTESRSSTPGEFGQRFTQQGWLLLNGAADLIIVDEAHTATRPRGDTATERSQQQRSRLIRELGDDPKRHVILVTATPHSGIEENFRSLLGLRVPQP